MGASQSLILNWGQFLEQNKDDHNLIRKEIILGIQLKSQQLIAYKKLTGLDEFVKQTSSKPQRSYAELSSKKPVQIECIEKDIPRVFSQQKKSKEMEIQMKNVLTSISNFYPQIGYQSGMAHFAYRFIKIFGEEEAFWMMIWIFSHHKMLYAIFTNPTKAGQAYCSIIDRMIYKQAKKLYQMFTHNHIDSKFYCLNWVKTLFSLNISPNYLEKIWLISLVDGSIVWLLVPLSIMICLQDKIMKSNRSIEKIIEMTNKKQLLSYHQIKDDFFETLSRLINKYAKEEQQLLKPIQQLAEIPQQKSEPKPSEEKQKKHTFSSERINQ